MPINCFICSLAVFDGFVNCSSHCNRVAHYNCAGISKEAYAAICRYDSVKWFCNDCNSINLSSMDNKLTLLSATVEALKLAYNLEPRFSLHGAVIRDNSFIAPNLNDLANNHLTVSDVPTPTSRETRSSTKAKRFKNSESGKLNKPANDPADLGPSYDAEQAVKERINVTSLCNAVSNNQYKDVLTNFSGKDSRNNDEQSVPNVELKDVALGVRPIVTECLDVTVNNRGFQPESSNSSIPSNAVRVVGTSTSSTLQSVTLRRADKWLHVSRLSPTTTLDQIYEFFSSTFKLNKEDIYAVKIIPKDRNPETITFISFKIGCSEGNFKKIMCNEKWPLGIMVKEFLPKNSALLLPIPAL